MQALGGAENVTLKAVGDHHVVSDGKAEHGVLGPRYG